MHSARYNLGALYLRSGNFKEAIQQFILLKKNQSLTLEGLNNLGKAYEGLREYQKAQVCYREALKKDPDSMLVLFNIGNLFYSQNDLDQAQLFWSKFYQKTAGKPEWNTYRQYVLQCLNSNPEKLKK